MAIHHPERVTKLVVTGTNSHTDGYTGKHWDAVNAKSDDWPASEAYGRLSPDGVEHWPIVLGRLQRMWAVEPNFTREEMQRVSRRLL